MTLDELYKSGEIGRGHYLTYLIFATTEAGVEWIDKMILSTFMEETPPMGDHAHAYYCGRISMLRNIQQLINDVQAKLEKYS